MKTILDANWPTRPRWRRKLPHYVGGVVVIGLAFACGDAIDILWPNRSYAAQTMSMEEAELLIANPTTPEKTRRSANIVAYLRAKQAVSLLASELNEDAFSDPLLRKLLAQLKDALGE